METSIDQFNTETCKQVWQPSLVSEMSSPGPSLTIPVVGVELSGSTVNAVVAVAAVSATPITLF